MDDAIFDQSIKFLKYINPSCILVTGGEPLEHPNFFSYMEKLIELFGKNRVIITSNGMFLSNETLTKKVLALGVFVQVTNDSRYYPKTINQTKKHKLLLYTTKIQCIYPTGRAKTNNIKPYGRNSPYCFNLRSIAIHNAVSFKNAVKLLEKANKFCTPSIDIFGNVIAGESSSCYKIGTINDSDEQLLKNLKYMKCNRCGMEDNLSTLYRNYVNLNK